MYFLIAQSFRMLDQLEEIMVDRDINLDIVDHVSSWSSTQSFTTASPCVPPTNPNQLNITNTSADLTWDAVSGAWGYRVMYLKLSLIHI